MGNLPNADYAFLFQGVGTEYKKVLNLLDSNQRKLLKNYCTIVNTEIELDLWGYLFDNIATKYDIAFIDWIAIYTIDNIVYETYINANLKPKALIGYSMGLITGLSCAKSISFESGLQMLSIIYQYPFCAFRNGEAMAVIIGLSYSDVICLIKNNHYENSIGIACENNEFCILISGNGSDVKDIMSIAENEGALKVKRVNSPFAFHHNYAKKGIEPLEQFVDHLVVSDSQIPIISTFNQKLLHSSYDLKNELVKNMYSQMWWKKSIEKAIEMGISNFVEVSLEDNITKFSKLINSNCNFITYKKLSKMNGEINNDANQAVIS